MEPQITTAMDDSRLLVIPRDGNIEKNMILTGDFENIKDKIEALGFRTVKQRRVTWSPPENGWIKLNTDGGFSHKFSCGIRGGILRDCNGEPHFAFADLLREGTSSYDGEATAILQGIIWASALGIKRLWVESDAKFLVQMILETVYVDLYDFDVVLAIRQYLKDYFEEFRLTYIPREGNEAANLLVDAIRYGPTACAIVWLEGEDLPVEVSNVVEQEREGCSYWRSVT